jgi:hypothetical protein
VTLKEKLEKMSTPAKRDQLAKECEGKVVGWGGGLVLLRGSDMENEMISCCGNGRNTIGN